MEKHRITFELSLPQEAPNLEALKSLARLARVSFDEYLSRAILGHALLDIESRGSETARVLREANDGQINERLLQD